MSDVLQNLDFHVAVVKREVLCFIFLWRVLCGVCIVYIFFRVKPRGVFSPFDGGLCLRMCVHRLIVCRGRLGG